MLRDKKLLKWYTTLYNLEGRDNLEDPDLNGLTLN